MEKKLILKYFLFNTILAVSTFEYFVRTQSYILYFMLPFVVFVFIYLNKKVNPLAIQYILPFVGAFLLQSVFYGNPFYMVITIFVRFLTIYLIAEIIGSDFLKVFVNSIKVFALISIILYSLQYIGPINSFFISLSSKITSLGTRSEVISNDFLRPNLVFYVLAVSNKSFIFLRNSGPFWEPGVYVIFLNIALFLNLFLKNRIFDKSNLLFIISIITSFSTTGYIVLLFIIGFFGFMNKSLSINLKILIFLVFIISVPVVYSLPFMSEKIEVQYKQSDISYSRFGAVLVHYKIVKDYPFSGIPWSPETYARYSDSIAPNGITNIFVRYGIFGGIFFYFFLFRFCSITMKLYGHKKYAIGLFFVSVISIFGETIGDSYIYLLMIFAQFPLENYLQKWQILNKNRIHNYCKNLN